MPQAESRCQGLHFDNSARLPPNLADTPPSRLMSTATDLIDESGNSLPQSSSIVLHSSVLLSHCHPTFLEEFSDTPTYVSLATLAPPTALPTNPKPRPGLRPPQPSQWHHSKTGSQPSSQTSPAAPSHPALSRPQPKRCKKKPP